MEGKREPEGRRTIGEGAPLSDRRKDGLRGTQSSAALDVEGEFLADGKMRELVL